MQTILSILTLASWCAISCAPVLASPLPTTTTLSLSPARPITFGTPVVLTASVSDSNSVAVTSGTVNFFDGKTLIGSAQIVQTGTAWQRGTANLKKLFGLGSHTLTAVFLTTAADGTSTSAAQTLVISGSSATSSAISSSAGTSVGSDYLTGTLLTSSLATPTGSFNFVDQSNANYIVGTSKIASVITSYVLSETANPFIAAGVGEYVIADFNQDGIPDVASLGDTNSVKVFLGDGAGGSKQAPGTPLSIPDADTLVAGDFNADGISDLAVSSESGSDGTLLYVFLGDGTGQFTAATGSPFSLGTISGASAQSMVVADFNGDGSLDIAETEYPPNTGGAEAKSNDLNILLGNGTGGFVRSPQSPLSIEIGNDNGGDETELLSGDFNGDGISDLVASDAIDNVISVLLGNGDGTFGNPLTTNVNSPEYIAVGDFNGDGNLDVVEASDSGPNNNLIVLLGDGTGRFPVDPASSGIENSPVYSVLAGDFDNDGNLDLAALVGPSLALFLGDGKGSFSSAEGSPFFFPSELDYAFAAADFNGDGTLDITALSGGTLELLLNNAASTAMATTPQISIPGAGSHNIVATYSGDSSYAASTSTSISLTGSLIPTTLALEANPASTTAGQSIIFTATLTPATLGGYTAGGSVTFSNGSAVLGSSSISSGAAVYTTTALPTGSASITASYGGDANFSTSTSGATTVTVSPAPAPDFTISVVPNALTIAAGQTGTATFTVTPENGFNSTVSFGCSGLPSEVSCTFSPASVTPNGAAATSTLTITTTAATALLRGSSLQSDRTLFCALIPAALSFIFLPVRRRRILRVSRHLTLVFLLTHLLASLTACGGSSTKSNPGTPAGTDTISITAATSGTGGVSHDAMLTVTITK